MKQIILVAHGMGNQGTFSIKNVRTITRSGESLSFQDAITYMKDTKTYPEYASTSFGTFSPLSDDECEELFNGTIPAGVGIVNTGLRRAGHVDGVEIFALRGNNITDADISTFISQNALTSLILLSCRS
ncbi:MAG: hypothetical protein ACO1G9_04040 [Bacteroidota bacterium]